MLKQGITLGLRLIVEGDKSKVAGVSLFDPLCFMDICMALSLAVRQGIAIRVGK